MQESFPIRVYSGLLKSEHRKRIGSALWEFLWCIDKTTRQVQENDEMLGLVLGGKPITLSEIAADLGIDRSTIHRNIEKLEHEGYVIVVRAPYGLILKVRNSKKWTIAKTQQRPNNWNKIVVKTQRALQKRNERCKNANSNKDNAVDNALVQKIVVVVDDDLPLQFHNALKTESEDEGIPTSRQGVVPANADSDADSGQTQISLSDYRKAVGGKYIQKRASGFDLSPKDEMSMNEIVEAKIPLDTVLRGIDKAFKDYKPIHDRDKIHSLNYCVPIVFDLFAREKIVKASQQSNKGGSKQVAHELPESMREIEQFETVTESTVSDEEFDNLLASMLTTKKET